MKRTILLLSACLLLLPCAARAAALDRGTVGSLETSVALDHEGLSSGGEQVATQTRLDGSLGGAYSLTRVLQVGGGLLFSSSTYTPEGEASSTWRSLGASVDVTANFRTPTGLIPFVRAGVGMQGYAGDAYEGKKSSLLVPMLRAGVRLLVGDAGSVNVSVSYRHESDADGVAGDDADRFGLALGLSLFPVRGK